jgi:glycosyltransferase involved in cell wall biosynthesis
MSKHLSIEPKLVSENEEHQLKLPAIAVVIPAYKAATHIRTVLANIPQFIRHVIVVDDGSPDDTTELVSAWADPRVRLVSLSRNHGVGGAVLTGYDVALKLGAEIIVKMDSDDQMDPSYLLPLIMPIFLGEADYAKGNRFLNARQLKKMPFMRRLGNIGLSFFTKLSSGYWNVFDPTNGYTAIHASVISLIDRTAIAHRYFFESSMFLELGLLRAVVQDVYIPARYAGEVSYLSKRKALMEFPWRLIRGFLRRLWVQHFVCDFGIFSILFTFGLLMLSFGLTFGIYHLIHSAQLGIATPTGTIMLAVLPIILGVQFLLQCILLDVQNVPKIPIHPKLKLTGMVLNNNVEKKKATKNNKVSGDPKQTERIDTNKI